MMMVMTPRLMSSLYNNRNKRRCKTEMNVKSIVTILLIAVVSMAFVGSASAATYYVNPGDSIQATINGAADGDTIVLNDGDYTENVVVNKSVCILSYGLYEYWHDEGWEIGGDYFFWWTFNEYYYDWNYTYEYDGAVIVTADNPRQDVFKVESDDVCIMNIDVDFDISGSGYYGDSDSYYWWFPWYGWWYLGYYEYDWSVHDNPMGIAGAYKSDAAGVHVTGATGTDLFNLLITGCDNGVKLENAADVSIELCEINGNDKEGILMLDTTGVLIADSVVLNSGKRGIEAENCADVELDQVAVVNSKKNGIDFTAVDGVLMYVVAVEDNGKTGVKLEDCTDVELVYSYIVNNGRSGLTMTDCDGTAVTDNEIAYNTKYGIKTHNAVNVIFDNNDVHDNGKADVKHFTSGSP